MDARPCAVVCMVILIILLLTPMPEPEIIYINTAVPVPVTSTGNAEKIRSLVTQARRWAVAASNDNNVFIKNLHANYAQGYVMAITDNYSEKEVFAATELNIRDISERVKQLQYEALSTMAETCPVGEPKDVFLQKVSTA